MTCRVCKREVSHDTCTASECNGDVDVCCNCCLSGFGSPLTVVDVEVYRPPVSILNRAATALPRWLESHLLSTLDGQDGEFAIDDLPIKENPNICYEVRGTVNESLITIERLRVRPRLVDGLVGKRQQHYSSKTTPLFCTCSNEFAPRWGRYGKFYGCQGYRGGGCTTTIPAQVVDALFQKLNAAPISDDTSYTVTSVFDSRSKNCIMAKRWIFELSDLPLFKGDAPLATISLIAIKEEPSVAGDVSEVDIEDAEPHLHRSRRTIQLPSPLFKPQPTPQPRNRRIDDWIPPSEHEETESS